MRIHVTLYSEFKRFAPGGASGPFDLDLTPEANLRFCFEKLHIPEKSEYTALINGRRANPESGLKEGDILVIFPLICGG